MGPPVGRRARAAHGTQPASRHVTTTPHLLIPPTVHERAPGVRARLLDGCIAGAAGGQRGYGAIASKLTWT